MSDSGWVSVLARGTWRGLAFDADGRVGVGDDSLTIQTTSREIRLRVDRLEGISWRTNALTLHLPGDESIELSGNPGLEAVMRRLTETAMRFPEVTRALGAMGKSSRGVESDVVAEEHDRFFGGLLRSRRFVEDSHELEPRLSAFSGRRLIEGFSLAFADFARDRYPTEAPDRRAVEAELFDEAELLFASLAAVDDSAAALRAAGEREQFLRWREWTGSVARAFREADRVWRAVLPLLRESRPVRPRRSRGAPRIRLSVLALMMLSGASARVPSMLGLLR